MSLAVTSAQLRAAAPSGDPKIIDAIAASSGAVFAQRGLTNLNRVLGFLSTALEESGFRTLSENLNYSASRAHEVWPSRFPTVASAAPYAGKPEALANRAYGGRMGNVGPDDGWRFRGQGLIQITGRENFAALAKTTGLPLLEHPELATDPAHMLEVSVAQFVRYVGILGFCDTENFHAVWALVGTGRSTGAVINLPAHEAALAALRKAIPALVEAAPVIAQAQTIAPPKPSPVPAAPGPASPEARLDAVQAALAMKQPTMHHVGLLAKLEAIVFGEWD